MESLFTKADAPIRTRARHYSTVLQFIRILDVEARLLYPYYLTVHCMLHSLASNPVKSGVGNIPKDMQLVRIPTPTAYGI